MAKLILILAVMLSMSVAKPAQAAQVSMAEIIELGEQQPAITVQGSNVRVTNASGQTLAIYNVAGVCVQKIKVEGADKCFELNLPKGCYILKVGKTVRKISIK